MARARRKRPRTPRPGSPSARFSRSAPEDPSGPSPRRAHCSFSLGGGGRSVNALCRARTASYFRAAAGPGDPSRRSTGREPRRISGPPMPRAIRQGAPPGANRIGYSGRRCPGRSVKALYRARTASDIRAARCPRRPYRPDPLPAGVSIAAAPPRQRRKTPRPPGRGKTIRHPRPTLEAAPTPTTTLIEDAPSAASQNWTAVERPLVAPNF
jgi:hypothetical protein